MSLYKINFQLNELKADAKEVIGRIRFWNERSETPYCSPVEQKTAKHYAEMLTDELSELLVEIDDLKSEKIYQTSQNRG